MENETVQITEIQQDIGPQQPKKETGAKGLLLSVMREIIVALLWVYIILKLFIFDIDIFLAERFFPNYIWILNFKFFILIGVVATIWLITKNKHILLWAFYILFYPAIILLWKIPFFILKQKSWVFAFAVINAVISFFKSIKYNFIASSFFLISLALIFGFSDHRLLWPAILALFVVLAATYINRFILVFKPSNIFYVYIKIFSGIRKNASSSFALDESIKNLPVQNLDQKQLEKWTVNLQTAVLFNRVCLFAAKKLRDYQNSGLNIVSYVLTILLLVLLTIFSFAAINFGLYKIDPTLFVVSANPTFFTSFYYSFNNLLFNSIEEVIPQMPISQSVSMIESFFALFLIVIFVSLLLSVRSQRHTEELNEAIKDIE